LSRHKREEKRPRLQVIILLAVAIIAVPSLALTLAALGLAVGVLFGWISRGLGKT
jgi:hypothetical protein